MCISSPLDYRWLLSELPSVGLDAPTVFSCFAGGGGSSMGYKLAGFKVLGACEIDSKMSDLYRENMNPKWLFNEPIQSFKQRSDIPQELFELDVLDGSPPCSSFSMSGNRDKDWGKHKQFREGQQKQVLDTLFFDFVDLAKRLQPKVVVAENVPGILYGKAKAYADKICDSLNEAGYEVMHYLLDAQRMGVPQRRKRVFFIAVRKDIAAKTVLKYPLSMDFVGPSIPAQAVQICGYNDHSWTTHDTNVWTNRQATDKSYSDVLMRLEGRNSNWNASFVHGDLVCPTVLASDGSKLVWMNEARKMNSKELCLVQSFPLDYNFQKVPVKYVCGMSVPPVMMAQIALKIKAAVFEQPPS